MDHALILLRSHLREEVRRGEVLLVTIPFGALALLIVPLAIGVDTPLLDRVGPGLFWSVVLLFGLLVTQRVSATPDQARRDLMALLGVDPAAGFLGAAAASGLLLIMFEIVVGAVMISIYDPDLSGWGWLAVVVVLTAAGLSLLGTLVARTVAGLGHSTTLAPFLIAPIAVPILLAAAQATEGLRAGAGILRWIILLAIVDIALALVGVLTARSLEEA